VLNTNAKIKKIKKLNGICKLCETADEDQKHLFLSCNKITPLDGKLTNKLEVMKLPKLNEENIIFGWTQRFRKNKTLNLQMLFIIING
jgi:hypothetical protein